MDIAKKGLDVLLGWQILLTHAFFPSAGPGVLYNEGSYPSLAPAGRDDNASP
jgi:hypothetical protein